MLMSWCIKTISVVHNALQQFSTIYSQICSAEQTVDNISINHWLKGWGIKPLRVVYSLWIMNIRNISILNVICLDWTVYKKCQTSPSNSRFSRSLPPSISCSIRLISICLAVTPIEHTIYAGESVTRFGCLSLSTSYYNVKEQHLASQIENWLIL